MDARTELLVRFRQDLVITETFDADTKKKIYLVKNPSSGEIFEFGEEEFFLCKSMNGTFTPADIICEFNRSFQHSLTEEYLARFVQQIGDMDLFENISPNDLVPAPAESDFSRISTQHKPQSDLLNQETDDDESSKSRTNGRLLWRLFDPSYFLLKLITIIQPIRIIFPILSWCSIGFAPFALATIIQNESAFFLDSQLSSNLFSFLGRFLFSLLLINALTRFVQSVVITYYGGKVTEVSLTLRWGIFPHFAIDKSQASRNFSRNEKLWLYGTILILKLFLLDLGIFYWHSFRSTGTLLSVYAIIIAQAAIAGLLLQFNPFRVHDGFRWLAYTFNFPPNYSSRILPVLIMTFQRRPLPSSISTRERYFLIGAGIIFVVFAVSLLFKVSGHIISGIYSTLPSIFGRATIYIIGIFVVWMMFRWLSPKLSKLFRLADQGEKSPNAGQIYQLNWAALNTNFVSIKEKFKPLPTLLILALIVLLILPFPYRPGGPIQLLPPVKQNVQAGISGEVVRVNYDGGDGRLIKSKTLIAVIRSSGLDNNIITLQKQIDEQNSNLGKAKATLSNLLNTPTSETVNISKKEVEIAQENVNSAREQVNVAQANVEAAKQQLESAIATAKYSATRALRYQQLYKQGVIAEQQSDDALHQADVDRISVEQHRADVASQQQVLETQIQNLAGAKKSYEKTQADLALVMRGPTQDVIEEARQGVASARSALERLQQDLKYSQEEQKKGNLLMPFDGYIVDSFLKTKLGSYISASQTFAVVQQSQKKLVELQLPEYDASNIRIGASAEIKLQIYPNDPMIGKVTSIEPAVSTSTSNTSVTTTSTVLPTVMFNILIDPIDPKGNLKPGMTGYGKIDAGNMPLIVLLTRPIVRFIQVEVWSWLP